MTLQKSADRAEVPLGEKITYTITISNTGDTTLTNVTLTDSMLKIEGMVISGNTGYGTLWPGESVTVTKDYTIRVQDLPGPVINTAIAGSDQMQVSARATVNIAGAADGYNYLVTSAKDNWPPIISSARQCLAWEPYQTNLTGDWEIFRLGELDGQPGLDPNISRAPGNGIHDIAPSRSPNGKWITFSSNRDGNWEVYITSSDGLDVRRVTENVSASDLYPIWGPHNYVVYQSNRDGNWEIYMFDVITGIETRLTDTAADEMNPAWSGNGAKIVYQSNQDGAWQIYEYSLRTGRSTRLTDGRHNYYDPVYSPDSRWVAYRADVEGDSLMYVAQFDGQFPRIISDPAGKAANPAWASDSSMLAYQSTLDGDFDIYIYDLTTRLTRKLTDNAVDDYAPAWRCGSPTLLFNSDVAGDPNLYEASVLPITGNPVLVERDTTQLTTNPSDDLYAMDASAASYASRQPINPVTASAASNRPFPAFPTVDLSPGIPEPVYSRLEPWRPINGLDSVCVPWILYSSNDEANWDILRVTTESTQHEGLLPKSGQGLADIMPDLSPDGKWMTFVSNRSGKWEVYIASVNDTFQRIQRVTDGMAIEMNPIWSPTGQFIVYQSNRDDNWDLYLFDIITGVEKPLTVNPGDDLNPSWSPDGSSLIFQSQRDGKWQIYLVDITTFLIYRLSDDANDNKNPTFSPDGSSILYQSQRAGETSDVLYMMSADGSRATPISDSKGTASHAAWSGDGSLIAYQSNADGDSEIYVYDLVNGQTLQVTSNNVADYAPRWQCGGMLLFNSEMAGDPDLFALPDVRSVALPVQDSADWLQLTTDPKPDLLITLLDIQAQPAVVISGGQ